MPLPKSHFHNVCEAVIVAWEDRSYISQSHLPGLVLSHEKVIASLSLTNHKTFTLLRRLNPVG